MQRVHDTDLIRLENITHAYATGASSQAVLYDVSFSVPTGQSCAIVGASGSGKSTLLNLIGLLDEPTSGRVLLAGEDMTNADAESRAIARNRIIGFVFQSFNLIPDLNVHDNVEVPLRYRGMKSAERQKRIQEALERVGLASRMKHYPAELSGGQQQRVAIARALAGSPRLLLADEPTGNLDTQMARGVMELLEEIHRGGATIVMVTHDPELAARAQRSVHIIDGQAVDVTEEPRFHAPPRHAGSAADTGAL